MQSHRLLLKHKYAPFRHFKTVQLEQQNSQTICCMYYWRKSSIDSYKRMSVTQQHLTYQVQYNAKTKLANMISQSVFGKTKQTYAYAKVLMNGYKEEIGTQRKSNYASLKTMASTVCFHNKLKCPTS